jgi:beta-lactamase superfamily II metal-dependent hydrolase
MLVRITDPVRSGRSVVALVVALCAVVLACASCGGSSAQPQDETPVIAVVGVEDGAVYQEPRTITVSVSPGVYTAVLNGQEFISGSTVSRPGTYQLVVDARNGTANARETISFQITIAGGHVLIVRMMDLGPNESGGGGDAILVTDSTAAGMAHMLVDAGPRGVDGADSTYVARRLAELGVDTLEALVLTHAHSDHFFGIPPVMRDVHVRRFFHNGQVRNFFRYNSTLQFAEARADTTFVNQEVVRELGGDPEGPVVTFLDAFPAFLGTPTNDGSMINEGSLGVSVRLGGFELFFAGDGEREANNRWRTVFPDLTRSLDVLKLGHHGANDAVFDPGSFSSSAWLDHADPRVGLITANGVTHPRQNAMNAVLSRGIETYCTHVHGEIVLRANGDGSYSVEVENNDGEVCTPGSAAET